MISQTDFGRMTDNQALAIPLPKELCNNDVIPLPFVSLGDDAFSLTEIS